MTSDLQIASNRENAQKSTGPRTTEGKARVAQNGVTHGLTGRFHLLDGESPELLDDLLGRLTACHCPDGESESFLVRQLAELQLRLDRAASLEADLMRAVLDHQAPARTTNARLADAFLSDSDYDFDTALLRLNRYESSLRRSHLATLRELRQQQKFRHGQQPVLPEPSPAKAKDPAPELEKSPRAPVAAASQTLDKANPVPAPSTAPAVHVHVVPADAAGIGYSG